ncbi:MAG: SDR family NAD(P)-dependent oxidoreductase [Bryobacterales bacterium]|nr:SDR family NAD(P)-dependent oxidoreductase [Bryobacterales bacterium]
MHTEIAEMFDLSGQVSLVVGGARHLGRDAACALAAAGSAVVITSRNQSRARETAAAIHQQYGVETLALALDHVHPESVAQALAAAAAWQGRLDIAINNAGGIAGAGSRDLLHRDAADIAALIELNLTGVVYCCQEEARHMLPNKRGVIVNIASIAGLVGRDRGGARRVASPRSRSITPPLKPVSSALPATLPPRLPPMASA